jgi:DDE superfamily endonuclease
VAVHKISQDRAWRTASLRPPNGHGRRAGKPLDRHGEVRTTRSKRPTSSGPRAHDQATKRLAQFQPRDNPLAGRTRADPDPLRAKLHQHWTLAPLSAPPGSLQAAKVALFRTAINILGRCEAKTGIKPFGRLVDQVLEQEPYRDADRLFYVVDNGSSHRGQASVQRMRRRDTRIILVHTPVHASWLNQVEIYFSIIQRKVLTPNDFANLDAVRLRLALYEQLSNRSPRPFAWKFTRQDLLNWLKRASPHFLAAAAA